MEVPRKKKHILYGLLIFIINDGTQHLFLCEFVTVEYYDSDEVLLLLFFEGVDRDLPAFLLCLPDEVEPHFEVFAEQLKVDRQGLVTEDLDLPFALFFYDLLPKFCESCHRIVLFQQIGPGNLFLLSLLPYLLQIFNDKTLDVAAPEQKILIANTIPNFVENPLLLLSVRMRNVLDYSKGGHLKNRTVSEVDRPPMMLLGERGQILRNRQVLNHFRIIKLGLLAV